MKRPAPPDAMPADKPTDDRPQPPLAEPVHAVTFRPKDDGGRSPSDRQPKVLHGWFLVVGLSLLVAAGGWLLHQLQQRPTPPRTEGTGRQTPAAADPAEIADTTPAEISGDSQSTGTAVPIEQAADTAEAEPVPASTPARENTLADTGGTPAPEPRSDSGNDTVQSRPPTEPNRQPSEALLSQGLDQLHRGQYRLARDTLLKAAALDPGSQAVRDALAQADQALKLDHLNRLRREATAAEKNGQWSTALERYAAALAIDPNVGFALRGKQHAIQRITIARRIDFYLAQPDALLNDRHFENAVQLLADAGELTPRDAELTTMMNQLDRLLTAAQTPVPVTLTSDKLTDVAVYRIGRMGRFDARNLSLRPGTYTVVGTRDGYRDVRLTVTVRPGVTPPPVHVACTQRIDGYAVQP